LQEASAVSQHDFAIGNQTFPAFRADLNAALAAAQSSNAGPSAPAETVRGQVWYDETDRLLKIRNHANTAWVTLFDLSAATASYPGKVAAANGSAGAPAHSFAADTDTGWFLAGANMLAASAGADKVLQITRTLVEAFVELTGTKISASNQFLAPNDDGPTRPGFSWPASNRTGMYRVGNNGIGWSVDGSEYMRLVASADFKLGVNLLAKPGHVGAPGIAFDGYAATGWFINVEGNLCGSRNGVKRIEISPTGVDGTFTGDGSGLTSLNAAAVRAVIAGMSAGVDGDYGFFKRASGTGGFNYGDNYAGSGLRASDSEANSGGTSPSGTWKCLGAVASGTDGATLFRRV
jgi:hypothetical protein